MNQTIKVKALRGQGGVVMLFNVNKGNLVVNGGFEQGLAGWAGHCNVGLVGSAFSHEGLVAAALGKPDNLLEASIYQDVCISPKRTYIFRFFVAGVSSNPADLTADVLWLDSCGNVICSALDCSIFVPGATTGPTCRGGYKAIVAYTERAPFSASAARILFYKAQGEVCDNFVLLDDVMFQEQC